MSRVDQTLHELADLFCKLYDETDPAAFRAGIDEWRIDEAGRLGSVSAGVTAAVEQGRSTPERIGMWLNSGTDLEGRRFAVLRGLDRAFAHIHPDFAIPPIPLSLTRLAAHVAAFHRLDSGVNGGALLPRVVTPGQHGQLPDHHRDAYQYVVRVPGSSWDACQHRALGEAALLHRHEIQRGLKVACVPLVSDPGELEFRVEQRSSGRFYRIRPRDLEVTRERISAVVAKLDSVEAIVGIAPESTLSPRLLRCWQEALRDPGRRATHLQWMLVGTGDLDKERRPRNTAVLLHGRTGEVLARQHKQYPFNFNAQELSRFGLCDLLGDTAVDEDLEPGERLCVLEGGNIRVAIAVCEDLARVPDAASHIRDFGVSHLLVPEFARPTKDRRWERAAADVYARSTGTLTVVANSLVVRSLLGTGEGSGLVVWPDAEEALVARASRPDELSCFILLPDGTAARA